ncbi:hypothetical protein [Cupriavidus sp. YAF13]|uniref:hypothetical protein n=1 Tax=Cupriavidus sp. YAF13 TaxID=3233075 RepID=UPI003F8DE6D3
MKLQNKMNWVLLAYLVVMIACALLGSYLLAACLFGVAVWLHRYDRTLVRRMEKRDATNWELCVRGVKVAVVSDADYAAMQRDALHDLRNAAAQFASAVGAVPRAAGRSISATAVWAPLCGLALIALEPEVLLSAMKALSNASPNDVSEAARAALYLIVVLSSITAGIAITAGARFGFVNRYAEAVARTLCQRSGVPADGDIVLKELIE